MARVFRFRNYGVYVYDERGAPHHLPHAHIKQRGRVVGSVFLLSLEVFYEVEKLPDELMQMLQEHQLSLIEKWTELNEDDDD